MDHLAGRALYDAHQTLMAEEPKMRVRDAAQKLGVSEAELVACRTGHAGVTRLKAPLGALIEEAQKLGTVMVLTRNEYVVHEKIGTFDHVNVGPGMGLVLNHDVDLRLFLSRWHYGFSVIDEIETGPRRSLQFFDGDGTAVHKIYVKSDEGAAAYDAIVAEYAHEDQTPEQKVMAPVPQKADAPDSDIDVAGMRAHWAALQDTHDFIHLLRDYGVGRQQALRLAGAEYAERLPATIFANLFEGARDGGVPIMVFVGNAGCIQIHTGPVENLKVMGPWYNVLDPTFNMHLRGDLVAAAWLVRKPTSDGMVTSVELYAEDGTLIAQMFGERKPGESERADWRALAEGLTRAESAAA